MKTHVFSRRSLHILYLIVFFGALLTVIWVRLRQKELDFTTKTELTRASKNYTVDRNIQLEKITDHKKIPPINCKDCGKLITEVLKDFSLQWTKNEENHQKLRSSLITNCNGFQKAFVTQTNSPLRTTIVYDWENRKGTVTEDLFSNFPKDVPFSDKILDTCAVVGNGGILTNSSCGAAIDSAQFVIRCNLPPLGNGYSKHVGQKTDLVTANPSILRNKYGSLAGRRRAFVDYVSIYGDAYMFLPAFSNSFGTTMSMTTLYTLEDFRSSVKAVFMNPVYIRSLDKYWRAQGVQPGSRMSTGFMMVSLALEICNNVDVYGFWPFDHHPYGFQSLTQHYYDNDKPNKSPHAMPAEFAHLIKLHNQGVLKLHVGECPSQ